MPRGRGVLIWFAAAACIAAGLAVVPATGAGAPASPQVAASTDTMRPTAQTRRARPFQHALHEDVSCRSCHGSGVQHRQLLVRTAFDCAACHHAVEQPRLCVDCHADSQLSRPQRVAQRVTIAEVSRRRVLGFDHLLHLGSGAGLECRDCHSVPVTMSVERTCTSCHEYHHRTEANCASCHQEPPAGVHGLESHASCAAAGCHTGRIVPAARESRAICLACHATMSEHQPGRACAQCHLVLDDEQPAIPARTGSTR